MIYLTLSSLLEMLNPGGYTLLPEGPTELVPDGSVMIFPASHTIPAPFDCAVFEGLNGAYLIVAATREAFEMLKAL